MLSILYSILQTCWLVPKTAKVTCKIVGVFTTICYLLIFVGLKDVGFKTHITILIKIKTKTNMYTFMVLLPNHTCSNIYYISK